ncbi:MAG TPA: hypothetical protein VJU60_01345 [Thermoleophilaceae bacterium]|nr:hypothetical protein [Thermoleophilaceae bacterium]
MSEDFQPIQPGEVAFRLDLTAAELKVTHTALKSLLDDYGHDEQDVIKVIQTVIGKLPDEHSIRAIDLKHEAAREVRSKE